jgi:F0F1-type ATP synthase assembly protein I
MKDPQREIKRKQVGSYARYTGLFFQMFVIIGVFAYVGSWLDDRQGTKQPYYTAALALIGVVIAIYQVLKEVNQLNNPKS